MRLELGAPVRCTDAELGEVADLVIDPATRCVTHLVVQPWHDRFAEVRLVPIGLVQADDAQQLIALRCTKEDFGRLESVREFSGNPPVDDQNWDVGVVDALAPPFLPPDDPEATLDAAGYPAGVGMAYDRIPKDEVELRRSSAVRSPDGRTLGHVEALIVDRNDQVTHFVIGYRRLLRRHNVEVPVASIEEIGNDVITVALTKKQVRALPADSPGRR